MSNAAVTTHDHEDTMSAPAPAPAPTGPIPTDTDADAGCDSCGVDMFGGPLRRGEFRIDTPAGPLYQYSSHLAKAQPGLDAQGLAAVRVA